MKCAQLTSWHRLHGINKNSEIGFSFIRSCDTNKWKFCSVQVKRMKLSNAQKEKRSVRRNVFFLHNIIYLLMIISSDRVSLVILWVGWHSLKCCFSHCIHLFPTLTHSLSRDVCAFKLYFTFINISLFNPQELYISNLKTSAH